MPPSKKVPDPATVVYSGVWKIATLVGGTFIAFYAVWTAYTGLGLPKFATYEYVEGHIKEVVQPIASKVDEQGVSILSGRIETLRGAKQLQVDAKSRLEIQSRTTKDPVAIQLIGAQQRSIDETIKGIDEQIANLSARLQATK